MGCISKGTKQVAFMMRIFSGLQLVTAIGFMIFSAFLQWPPKDSLTIILWLVGALSLFTSILGFCVSAHVRCCLGVYATFAFLLLAAESAIVAYLFIAPDKAVQQLSKYDSLAGEDEVTQNEKQAQEDNIEKVVNIGRWVLLALVGLQCIAVVFALVLRCFKPTRSYEQFEEAKENEDKRLKAESQLKMLKAKVLHGQTTPELKPARNSASRVAVPPDVESGESIGAVRPSPSIQRRTEVSQVSAWSAEQRGVHPQKQSWKPTWQRKAQGD